MRNTLRATFLGFAAATAVLAGVAASPSARAEEKTVEVLPRWRKSERVFYEVATSRKRVQGGKVATGASARTDVEIAVLEAGENGFVVEWTAGATRYDDPGKSADPIAKFAADLLAGARIVLELDREASVRDVRNWKELKAGSVAAWDAMTERMKAEGRDAAMVDKIRAQAATLFSTKPQVVSHCTRQPQLFFLALGVEFVDGAPVEYEDKLPNPFGGEAFPSKAKFELTAVDRNEGVARVLWTQTIPPAEAARIMGKTIDELARRLGKPPPDAEALKSFTIEDRAEYALDLSTGWPRSVSYRRTTRTGDESQEDGIRFERRAPAPATGSVPADFPDDANGRVLRQLRDAGDDLTSPRDVDFEFVFREEAKARTFVDEVKSKLKLVAGAWSDDEEDEESWFVTVTKNMVPTHGAITAVEAELTRMAALHGGEPDGWGCPVVPKDK